ncbi:MAG: M15 family metallopeptidase [Saprospiraceae bacterium]
MKYLSIILSLTIILSCKSKTDNKLEIVPEVSDIETIQPKIEKTQDFQPTIDYDDDEWEEIVIEDGVIIDIRYATKNNFTKKQIYPCARCFLRPVLAKKIKKLQKDIKKRYGMSLKFFDCYRPRPAQQLLWDIVPDARYVTPPKKGSMHNRGLALDVTLVDNNGKELDMGTPYDYFGEKAYPAYQNLPKNVIKNRQILLKMMEAIGLKGIRTEWWHFSLKSEHAELDDWQWKCD